MKFHRKCILFWIFGFLSQNLFSQPTITSFSPGSGPVGSAITITGTNFSNTAANNIVFFGAVRAIVSVATSTSLTVTVPAGNTYQPISVTVNGLTAYSGQSFITTFAGATSQFTSQSFEYTARVDSVSSNIETTKYSIGDIDGDGKIDIITIDRLNNTMSVYRNTSSGGTISFAAKVDFTTGQSPRSVKVADLDGDGKPDVIVTNLHDNTVSLFKNTGTGTNISFAPKVDFITATQPAGISVADLDKDGKPDLVINTVNLEGYVSVLRNTSSGATISFAPKTDLQTTGGSIEDIKTADIDGDGKTDIVIPNYSLNLVSFFINTSTTGNIHFASQASTGAFQNPVQIELGDFNLDGKPDMIVGHYVNTNSPVFKNTSTTGNIVFQYGGSYQGGVPPTGLAINDLDGDGKPDFVTANGLESFSLYKNNSTPGGNFSFSPGVTLPALYNTDVVSADFDGDGIPDLAFNTGIGRVTIWKNRATNPQIYSFSPASGKTGDTITIHGAHFSGTNSVSFGGVEASSFLVSDPSTIKAIVTNGSSGDIVVRTSNDSAFISGFMYLGPPVLTSFNPAFGGTGDTIVITGLNFTDIDSVSFGGMAAASFMLTAPGVIKAVVGAGSSGNISVSNPYGTGTLPGFIYFPLPVINSFTPTAGIAGTSITISGTSFSSVRAVSVGGKPVVSFSVLSSTTITAIVSEGVTGRIRVTTPGGTGVSSGIFSFPKPGISVLVPASGAPGSIITIQGSNFISDTINNIVLFGAVRAKVLAATNSSLTVRVPAGVTYEPVSVTLNGYTVYSELPFIQTFQDGNGGITPSTFTWKGAFVSSSDPRDDYLYDIDGDGKPDIITRNDVTGGVSVLLNTSTLGNPSFAPRVDIMTLVASNVTIKIGDINSDGKPDVVMANLGGRITILRNTSTIGNISFVQKNLDLNYDPTYVTLQDFDGDGKVDLAACSNDVSGTFGAVTIYPNIGTEGDIVFGPAVNIGLSGSPIEIQSADLDHDGKPDIILKNGDGVTILRNLGSPGNFSFDSPKNFSAFNSSGYFYYCIADFDGDGKPDIASSADGNFYVLHNTTSNNIISFDPKMNFPVNEVVEKIIPGQLDGDGKPDLIIVGDKKIFLYRNQSSSGNISFDAPVIYPSRLTYNWTDDAAIGDLDGDGKPDIAIANGADEKVAVFRNEMYEMTDSVCENNNTSFASNIGGSNYHWQLNTGAGFNNLNDDSIYHGAGTATLQIRNVPMLYNGYQFRCVVDGNYSNTTNVIVSPAALPLGSASSPDVVCADSIFNIVFTEISGVPVNSTLEIWEKADSGSFALIASQPYNGNPFAYPVTVNSASIKSYFFRIIPPAATLCGIPNNSDTTTTVITQLVAPVIDTAEYTMTISNPNADAVYTWQLKDSLGIWNDVVPATQGIRYTAVTSGDYRVMGILGRCSQYSDKQKILIAPVPNISPQVFVYPNPASNQITVAHPASGADAKIRLIDLSGRIVKEVPVAKNSTETVMGVGNIKPGIFKIIWTDGKDSFAKTVLISR